MQSEWCLNFLRPLSEISLTFLKNSAELLDKNVLFPLGLIEAAASATDVGIQEKKRNRVCNNNVNDIKWRNEEI